MNANTLEQIVYQLTLLTDLWKLDKHAIYLLRDGIPPGLSADVLVRTNRQITMVLGEISAATGRPVTNDVIDDIIEFVENTRENDDFND